MLKDRLPNTMSFVDFYRGWLAYLLLFLPFQNRIAKGITLWNNQLATMIGRIDEITIIIGLLLVINGIYKNKDGFNYVCLFDVCP